MPRLPSSIIPKASAVSGEAPSSADLVLGEIAVNTADGTLFTKHVDSSIVTISGPDTYVTVSALQAASAGAASFAEFQAAIAAM